VESDLADVEVFFEAIELEKVGEFERADVTATGTDFLLQIAHDAPELLRSEAGAQELEPEPLTIIAKGKLLAGELAVEPMDVLYGRGDFVVRHKGSLLELVVAIFRG
jgi:cellobiose-specific phosphotransferase system component IIA